YNTINEAAKNITKIREVRNTVESIAQNENVTNVMVTGVDLGSGTASIAITVSPGLFYQVLGETTGFNISGEGDLIELMMSLSKMKKEYDKIKGALEEVNATGYGIVMPTVEELKLEEPEMLKQGGRFGVRLEASSDSIHMIKCRVVTEINPLVGSEKQSEELVNYFLKEFEDNPDKIWDSNIFGKSLHELVTDELHNKLHHMPADARLKIQETLERIINEGCGGLICILL
ncbi:MAG: stage IV sporulation protein A, partial [[Clostridium] cellulosi]